MSRALILLLSLFTMFNSCYSQRYVSSDAAGETSPGRNIEQDILYYVNQYRESKGLPALEMNDIISEQAEMHSRNMAKKAVPFSHDGFESRIQKITTQLGQFKSSAENVAYGELSAKEVVDIWLKSPGHRKNIEGNYAITGIGTAVSKDGTIYFTQIFGIKM